MQFDTMLNTGLVQWRWLLLHRGCDQQIREERVLDTIEPHCAHRARINTPSGEHDDSHGHLHRQWRVGFYGR